MSARIGLVLLLASLLLMVAAPASAQEGKYCVMWNDQVVYCITY